MVALKGKTVTQRQFTKRNMNGETETGKGPYWPVFSHRRLSVWEASNQDEESLSNT